MTFKRAVSLSVALHVSLGVLALVKPAPTRSGETTYYVDLIQGGGGGGDGGGPRADAGGKLVAPAAEAAGRVRDLTVDAPAQKPSLRYPDREGRNKTEAPSLISVVRKERPTAASGPATQEAQGSGLKMGISAGGGAGGSGTGGGDGTGGGYFPYAYYVETLKSKISSSWYSSLVSPGLSGRRLASVYFKIHRDGRISDLAVERSSGSESLDLSALRAVQNSAPFAPLPNDFPYPFLAVHFEFEWEK